MRLLVLNQKFETIAFVDNYASFIWTDRYNEYGDFELSVTASKESIAMFQLDNYLWFDESDHLMIIEEITIKTDLLNGKTMLVTGRSLESLLTRRIIWEQTNLECSLQDAIRRLLNDCIISPSLSLRKIDNFDFQESTDITIGTYSISSQYTGDNLYEVICDICKTNNIGFKIILNDNNHFVFSLYNGEDRSYSQTTNTYVIFSPTFENIANSNYLESNKTLKNVSLIAGEGEGTDRRTTTIGAAKGISRREIFVDARDVSSNDGEIPDSEYIEKLEDRGETALLENTFTKTFEGEVESKRLFKYNSDFFIGDIVEVINEFDIKERVRITEFIRSNDNNGYNSYPTFETIEILTNDIEVKLPELGLTKDITYEKLGKAGIFNSISGLSLETA